MLLRLTSSTPVEVFISYASEDKKLREELVKHLRALEYEGVITAWHDHVLVGGDEWWEETEKHLNRARVILLLVSENFLASPFAYGIEFQRAKARLRRREARVIPVILSPCQWKETSIGEFQALPEGGKPIVTWKPRTAGFQNVCEGLKRAIEELPPSFNLLTFLRWAFLFLICASALIVPVIWFFSSPQPLRNFASDAALASPAPTPASTSFPTQITTPSPTPPGASSSPRLVNPNAIKITITEVPIYDPVGGTTSQGRIAGKVSGVNPDDYRVVIYSYTNIWYVQPTTIEPKTEIQSDGTWEADIQLGSTYAAFIVPPDHNPPRTTGRKSIRIPGAIAASVVQGKQ